MTSTRALDRVTTGRLQVGDVVLVRQQFTSDISTSLHFVRRQRIKISQGALFKVANVILGGDFILNSLDVFNDGTQLGSTMHAAGDESMILCSKADEEKVEVMNKNAVVSNEPGIISVNSAEERDNDGREYGDEEVEENRMMLIDCVSFKDISIILSQLDVELPMDVRKLTASFLQVKNIDTSEISVIGASSTRGDYPLSSVLGSKHWTWWISAEHSMKNGLGEEYLEFSLSPDGTARRCSYVGISIPPLPQGPLSVRNWKVDWSYDGKNWTSGCRKYTMETMDSAGIQSFKLHKPIDAARVRLVCLTNAFASEQDRRGQGRPTPYPFNCVGLFHVRWK